MSKDKDTSISPNLMTPKQIIEGNFGECYKQEHNKNGSHTVIMCYDCLIDAANLIRIKALLEAGEIVRHYRDNKNWRKGRILLNDQHDRDRAIACDIEDLIYKDTK
jgi:hypothetical protein